MSCQRNQLETKIFLSSRLNRLACSHSLGHNVSDCWCSLSARRRLGLGLDGLGSLGKKCDGGLLLLGDGCGGHNLLGLGLLGSLASLADLALESTEEALGDGRGGRLGRDNLGVLGIRPDILRLLLLDLLLLSEAKEARLALLLGGRNDRGLGLLGRGGDDNIIGSFDDGLLDGSSEGGLLSLVLDNGGLGSGALVTLSEEAEQVRLGRRWGLLGGRSLNHGGLSDSLSLTLGLSGRCLNLLLLLLLLSLAEAGKDGVAVVLLGLGLNLLSSPGLLLGGLSGLGFLLLGLDCGVNNGLGGYIDISIETNQPSMISNLPTTGVSVASVASSSFSTGFSFFPKKGANPERRLDFLEWERFTSGLVSEGPASSSEVTAPSGLVSSAGLVSSVSLGSSTLGATSEMGAVTGATTGTGGLAAEYQKMITLEDDVSRLTQLLQDGLVALGGSDLLLCGLSLDNLGLEGEDPVVALNGGSLEVQVAGSRLQDKLVGTALGDLGDVGQLNNSMGSLLVSLVLGVEPQTLSGLAGICRGSLGRVCLVLEVCLQVLFWDGLILEVEEPLKLEEAMG